MRVKFLKEIEVRISRDFVVEFCRVDVYKLFGVTFFKNIFICSNSQMPSELNHC